MKSTITNHKKNRKTAKLQEKQQHEFIKRKIFIRKENESNKERKQNERKQKRENMEKDIGLGKFFELATSNKNNVNSLNLHEVKTKNLQDY